MVQFKQNPIVEDRCRLVGSVFVEPKVVNAGEVAEKGVHVPPGQDDLTAHFVAMRRAEVHVAFGRCGCVKPAHHVHTELLSRVLKPDGVALGFVHGLAVVVRDQTVTLDHLKRCPPLHHRADGEQCVEPVAELSGQRFDDKVCREPLFPIFALAFLVAEVTHRGKRYDARVEPRVAHVLDTRHVLIATLFAADFYAVDPGTMGRVSVERVPAGLRLLFKLFATTDDVKVAARATFPDGQRQSPIALLGDHPVAHVAKPIQLALHAPRGNPSRLLGGGHDFLAQLRVHVDEPLVDEAIGELLFASPAVRIAVDVPLLGEENFTLLQIGDDFVGNVVETLAGEEPELRSKASVFVQRGDLRQA